MSDIFINIPNPDAWVRNPDWMDMPIISSSEEKLAGLFLVYEGEHNGTTIQSNNGGLHIDWGDGTSITSSGATQGKIYDYNAMTSSTVYTDENGKNYKQAMVTMYGSGTTITFVSLDLNSGSITSNGTNNYVDILCSFPSMTIFRPSIGRSLRICERFRLLDHSITNGANLFRNANKLQVLEMDLSSLTSLSGIFSNGSPISELNNSSTPNFLFNSGGGTTIFQGSNIPKIGTLTLSGSAATNVLFQAHNLESIDEVNLLTETTAQSMFNSAVNLKDGGVVDIPKVTNTTTMYSYCYALTDVDSTNCDLVTTSTNMFIGCYSLSNVTLDGFKTTVIVQGNMISSSIDTLFTSLGAATGSQTITVSTNPGASTCDTSIATGKGWTVVN